MTSLVVSFRVTYSVDSTRGGRRCGVTCCRMLKVER